MRCQCVAVNGAWRELQTLVLSSRGVQQPVAAQVQTQHANLGSGN